MKLKFLIILSALSLSLNLYAQNPSDTSSVQTFQLGEVTVTGYQNANNSSEIQYQNIQKYQKSSISSAINLLPGINISQVGGRNEAMVYVRGYDLRQVPVFIDGMPVYVPYDGYIDMARLQSANISKISVSKGFSSMLYGANSMGGAINIISAKPASKLEFEGNTGGQWGHKGLNGYNSSANIGTRLNKFYAMANVSFLNRDYLTLPLSMESMTNETDHRRDNSYTKDIQYQVLVGFEPIEGHEYALSYSGVRSEKGVPVYLGTNPSNKVRYWQYPSWNKDCYYFHSRSMLSEKIVFKTRLFYDTYYNVLKSFDDNTYTTQLAKSAFTSIYDDNSLGGAAELEINSFMGNEIKVAVNSKLDYHKEYNVGQKPRNIKDITTVYAIEDSWKIVPKLNITGGIGYYTRDGIEADDYNSTKDSVYSFVKTSDQAFNYQLGVFFEPVKNQLVYATVANKSRFATMKDRYSYRFGTAIPNPDLSSEQALNTEIGYSGNRQSIQWSVAGFYNFIDNTIQQVNEVQPGIYQLQNTGKAEFRGIEAALGWNISSMLSIGSSYTFIDRKNISNPNIKFIDVPENKLLGYIKAEKKNLFYVMLDAEYNSERMSTSDGVYKAPAYTILNLNAEYYPVKNISLKLGVHNIADKLYYVTEGYPEEGRTLYLALTYKFAK